MCWLISTPQKPEGWFGTACTIQIKLRKFFVSKLMNTPFWSDWWHTLLNFILTIMYRSTNVLIESLHILFFEVHSDCG